MKSSIAPMIFLFLGASPIGAVATDDPPTAETQAEAKRSVEAVELAKAEAGLYRLHMEGEASPAALKPDALLRWSNPVAGSIHGSVFVWIDRGCPVAVSSIYKWYSPNTHLGVELHSLSPKLESADRRGRPAWKPGQSPVERKPIPGAPRPADAAPARLRQLRTLAAEFTAKETTRESVIRDLRLLTQPILRYQSTDPDVIDGALFAFVQGTDPEIILIIEARKTLAGPEWQFSAARMNSLTLNLNHKARMAWTVPEISWGQARNHAQAYTLFLFGNDPGMTFDDPGE